MLILCSSPVCKALYEIPKRVRGPSFTCIQCHSVISLNPEAAVRPIRVTSERTWSPLKALGNVVRCGRELIRAHWGRILLGSLGLWMIVICAIAMHLWPGSIDSDAQNQRMRTPSAVPSSAQSSSREQTSSGATISNPNEASASPVPQVNSEPPQSRPETAALPAGFEEVELLDPNSVRPVPADLPEPESGFRFDDNALDGAGSLAISNHTGHSAIVKLRGPSEQDIFSWFVKNGTTRLSGIPDQNYRLEFCAGDGWVKDPDGINGAWFLSELGCSRLDRTAHFETLEGVSSTEWSVTLHEVANGNVTRSRINKRAFLSP